MDDSLLDDDLRSILAEVEDDRSGEPSDYLADVDGADVDGLAAAVCTTDGHVAWAGDAEHRFALQSVSKALAYAAVLQEVGLDAVLEQHELVESVNYPGLKSSRYHELAKKYLNPDSFYELVVI